MKKYLNIILIILTGQSYLLAQEYQYSKERSLPCVNKTFMVNVHIVKDSLGDPIATEAEVKEILDKATKAFGPICINFNFCAFNYVDDYAYLHIDDATEIKLLTSRYNKKRRINLYIVESYFDAKAYSYSIYNGISEERTGVVILPKTGLGILGLGIEHELGHLFGLYHTHETKFGDELVDGSNCETAGDRICDTPADPNILIGKKCEFRTNKPDANDDQYRTDIGNYMSHYFCGHCYFTHDQYEMMANNFLTSTFKMW